MEKTKNPYTNQSIDDLKKRAEQIKAAIAHKEAREKESRRKKETRAKIILGGLALRHLPADQIAALASHASERDRAAIEIILPSTPLPPPNPPIKRSVVFSSSPQTDQNSKIMTR